MSHTKKVAQLVTKSLSIDDDRVLHFISTAPTLDRDFEVISTGDIRVPTKNGIKYASELTTSDETIAPLLIEHEWNIEAQAGMVFKMMVNTQGQLESWAKLSTNDNGELIYQMAKEDMLGNSFSIGYTLGNATDENGQIKNIELLEVSVVATASNPDARLISYKSADKGEKMAEATKLEKIEALKAELKSLEEPEVVETPVETVDKEALKVESEKIVKSFIAKTKGLVAEIASADDSWDTQDEKYDAMEDVSELFYALQQAWFFAPTPISDFNTLVSEFATLVMSVVDGTYSDEDDMSPQLTKALGEKTIDDVKKVIASMKKVEKENEEVTKTEDITEVETPVETKSIEKETKMTDVTKSIVPEVVETVEQPATETKSMDKYDLVAKQFVAFVNKDRKTLSELNEVAIKSYADQSGTKATYMNAGIVADGGAIVPSAQLLAEVYTVLNNYSTISGDLKVVTLTEGNALDIASLVTDVIIREVATEGGKKQVTKEVMGRNELTLREFAGIAIVTKKLVRQAAINIFDLLRDSFARAIATQRATMALTDATSGIGVISGTATTTTAGAVPTYAEIAAMAYAIPAGATQGAKYYLARSVVASLASQVATTGQNLNYVKLDGSGISGTLANGFPFAVEEVLQAGTTKPLAVFGNASRYGILLRQGVVEAETFDTGVVNDGTNGTGGVDHNLLQDNKLAYRVAFYENVGFPVPSAFAVLKQI